MENIWGIILQSMTVTLTAVLLLLLKWVMADKLSPRWQYGVWSVLALRMLVPVTTRRFVFGPLPFWVEIWKGTAEAHLNSAYSAVYEPTAMKFVLPRITGAPVSVTDWLFIVYSVGIIVFLLNYLFGYLRLRKLLRGGEPASREMKKAVRMVCTKYRLRRCDVVEIQGLPSAFVSGIFRPVLAVPMGAQLDEKIILHELLHLNSRDSLQSVFWCLLRCLHWFNPLMHYVFNRIGNDMESLCDQRVLERLEGEERREYGEILLGMANDRYARVPGTTSISNGGKNIARRIQAIVRFKKYPRGMELVSACSILILLSPVMVGTAADYDGYYTPAAVSELTASMAMARLNRCTTKAGALDTYAKGLIYENGIYIAMVSPAERHGELAEKMLAGAEKGDCAVRCLDSGWELEYVRESLRYGVYNLQETGEDEYTAVLFFYVTQFWDEEGNDFRKDEDGEVIYNGSVLVPVRLWKEDGWLVEECGQRKISASSTAEQRLVEPIHREIFSGETGNLTLKTVVWYVMPDGTDGSILGGLTDNGLPGGLADNSFPGGQRAGDEMPVIDAEFESAWVWTLIEYDIREEAAADCMPGEVGFRQAFPLTADTEVIFPEFWNGELQGHDISRGIRGSIVPVPEEMPVKSSISVLVEYLGDSIVNESDVCWIGIYWDGKFAESIRVEGMDDE